MVGLHLSEMQNLPGTKKASFLLKDKSHIGEKSKLKKKSKLTKEIKIATLLN
jgi:hypothetical protein